MQIDVLSIFPAMFAEPFAVGMMRKAREVGAVELRVHDLRDWAADRHHVTDDYAFGGGPGMVMKPEPLFAAVEALRTPGAGVVLLSPQGRPFSQPLAREYATRDHLILICGRYEGVDERVVATLCTDEVSIGDYVLTGGELPAMVLVDAVVRLLPGVLAEGAAGSDSFADGLLEGPHYTRPQVFRGMAVPDVLISGNHESVRRWRRKEALRRTWQRRPDLLAGSVPSPEDQRLLAEMLGEERLREQERRAEQAPRHGAGQAP